MRDKEDFLRLFGLNNSFELSLTSDDNCDDKLYKR